MIFEATKFGTLIDIKNNKNVLYLDNDYFSYTFKLNSLKEKEIKDLIDKSTFSQIEKEIEDDMFVIRFEYPDFSDNLNSVYFFVDFAKNLGIDKSRILCEFGHGNYTFDQVNNVIEIHNNLAKEGIASCFETSTIEEAIEYNTKARQFVKIINKMKINGEKLSPFEKYVLIYRHVTDRFYSEDYSDLLHARNHISAYSGDKVVCVGFAKLLAQLCKECGLNCQVNSAWVGNINERQNPNSYNHKNNILYIDDPKYNLKGVFLCDSCWDSKNNYGETFLSNMLVPINDTKHLQKTFIIETEFQKDFQTIPTDKKSIDKARITLEETYIKDTYATSCLRELALENLRNNESIQEYCLKKDKNLEDLKNKYFNKASNLHILVKQDKEKLEALGFDFNSKYNTLYKKELLYYINGGLNGYNLNYDKLKNFKFNDYTCYGNRLSLIDLLTDFKEAEILCDYRYSIDDIINADKEVFGKQYIKEILDIHELSQKPKNITLNNLAKCIDVVAKAENQMYGTNLMRREILKPTLSKVTSKVVKNEKGEYSSNKTPFDLNKTDNWLSQFWRQNFSNKKSVSF